MIARPVVLAKRTTRQKKIDLAPHGSPLRILSPFHPLTATGGNRPTVLILDSCVFTRLIASQFFSTVGALPIFYNPPHPVADEENVIGVCLQTAN
jgi:hypothetical protein